MKYTVSKIVLLAFCSIFFVIGGVSLLSSGGRLFEMVFGGMFIAIPLLILVSRWSELSKFQKMTYDWYKAAHPDAIKDNKVSCFGCGNDRINVRGLMNRTFHREHLCTQCGKTLYYSREGS